MPDSPLATSSNASSEVSVSNNVVWVDGSEIDEDISSDKGGIPPSFGNLSLLDTFSASKNNLLGKIPDELCQLLNLKYFVVNENNLSGTLPPCLFNRSSIVAIDVGTNHLEGKLPPLLGISLPNLEFISIYRNNVTGNISVTLSNATNLQSLIAGRNRLTGKVPPIGNLLKMRRFLVAFNYLGKGEDDDLSFLITLVNATSLELLELNTNNFGGVLPASISNLSTELIELSLSYNQISGEIPRGITNLKKLQAFFVAYNRFHDEIPSEIASLTKLSLRENNLQGRIPSSLGKCHNLELLDLGSNNLSGFIPSEILELLSEGVDLSQNQLTGFLPMKIGKLRSLGYLNLSDNKLQGQNPTSIGGIPGFLKDFKFLQILNLSSNTLEGVVPTGGIFSNATVVSIIGNRNLCGGVPELDLPACVVEVKKERKSELGMGSDASIYGDVYNFGILLLEMFTGRKPTDEMFKDNLNLHNYANVALPDRMMHLTDPILLQERDEHGMKYKVNDNTSSVGDIFLSFLVKVIQIGVSCSVESPKERKRISDVVGELNSLRKLFLEQAYPKEKVISFNLH
ncbi:hypothetical protein KY289_019313 [Solanum tuberosum]|nr:hypothetical protein KY289_019313 [Solanum tuberosum]